MPKVTPHPHVAWRDGRPRFSPGAQLRARGHKSKDLRHPDGRWFGLGDAVEWSRAFCIELATGANAPDMPPENKVEPPYFGKFKRGYIYFLWAGDAIKIGFSSDPALRIASLLTGVATPVKFWAAVEGTRADEKALHERLSGSRSRGEWFKPTLSVIRTIQRLLDNNLGPYATNARESV